MLTEANKAVVRRFNREVVEHGDRAAFEALVAAEFVNRSAPAGQPNDAEALWSTFDAVLRPALTQLSVTIHDQIAEGDKVTTRKSIYGRHTGTLLGAIPTGRTVLIEVLDVVRLEEGRYVEHWGINTLAQVVASLKEV